MAFIVPSLPGVRPCHAEKPSSRALAAVAPPDLERGGRARAGHGPRAGGRGSRGAGPRAAGRRTASAATSCAACGRCAGVYSSPIPSNWSIATSHNRTARAAAVGSRSETRASARVAGLDPHANGARRGRDISCSRRRMAVASCPMPIPTCMRTSSDHLTTFRLAFHRRSIRPAQTYSTFTAPFRLNGCGRCRRYSC